MSTVFYTYFLHRRNGLMMITLQISFANWSRPSLMPGEHGGYYLVNLLLWRFRELQWFIFWQLAKKISLL